MNSNDVAARAGVSRSAVSRTFTAGASVSAATRARVLAAAEALGYQPNLMARSLGTQRSNLIALVMGQLRNPFFTDMLGLFEARFRDLGFQTLLVTPGDDGGSDEAISQALQYQIGGVVTVAAVPSKHSVVQCTKAGVPVVVIDREAAPAPASLVWIDSAALGRDVAGILLAEGRRRAAVIEGRPDGPMSNKARSFISHWERAGGSRVAVEHGAFTYEGGAAAALRLLAARNRPDAIFCMTDLMAFGALDAARHALGLAVPEQLSIVGFGNLPASAWLSHQLSTVRTPIDQLVSTAVDVLAGRMEKQGQKARPKSGQRSGPNSGQKPARILVSCSFVPRQTTLPSPEPAAGRARGGRSASRATL